MDNVNLLSYFFDRIINIYLNVFCVLLQRFLYKKEKYNINIDW